MVFQKNIFQLHISEIISQFHCYIIKVYPYIANELFILKALRPLEATSARTISGENLKHIYFYKVNFPYNFWARETLSSLKNVSSKEFRINY